MARNEHLMASVSGVRGIVGPGMNPVVAARYTAAFAEPLRGGIVVVGRDTRPSGPILAQSVVAALRFMGITAVDLGIASTPTTELMVRELGADGGIIITASHNGAEWNALKFLDGAGEFLGAAAMADLIARVERGEVSFDRPATLGAAAANDRGDAIHIARILELERVDRERVAARRFRAVVDCVNGAGSRIVPALLRDLGVAVTELYCDADAPFPHEPEPRPAALTDLSRAVAREKADIGFACDPDADRLVLVDGAGNVLSEELTLAVASDFILEREKGPLVANLSSSRVIDDIGRARGVPVLRAKVGEANVIELMKSSKAAIGGEGNGGVIYPPLHYGRDAMLGIALVLQSLAEKGITLAEKVAMFPAYAIVKEKFAFSGDFASIEKAAENRFRGVANAIDGIRIDMDEGWVHLRRSNTEPVVRIIAEARSVEEARRLAAEAANLLS